MKDVRKEMEASAYLGVVFHDLGLLTAHLAHADQEV